MRRLNDGSGHFTTSGQSFTTCQADQVELADVTSNGTDYVRDGKLDAVLFCVDSGTLARMAGDGDGGFGAPHAGTAFLNSPSLASADHFALGAFTDYDRPPLALYRTQDGQLPRRPLRALRLQRRPAVPGAAAQRYLARDRRPDGRRRLPR